MGFSTNDLEIIRDLARQYAEISSEPIQEERRRLWMDMNSLRGGKPLIYVRAFAWKEMPQSSLKCENSFLRNFENFFRNRIFWHSLNDDSIFEPWVPVQAVTKCAGWGVEVKHIKGDDPRGAYKIDYPIRSEKDIDRLRMPCHEIDEEKTAEKASRLHDALGDIIDVDIERSPWYWRWSGDISMLLGQFRGIEHLMMDMVDQPEFLHKLTGFLSRGIRKVHDQAEENGDWGPSSSYNQAMPYAHELARPSANQPGIKRKEIWGYQAAQELTGVSPAMHEEFLLRHQMPIMETFGLVAYGCCEDLTNKIDMLRAIPNLRRIAVAPFADTPRCAEQIGTDYVLSYRPSPTDMVGYGFDPDRIRSIMNADLEACRDCHVDITLKDVETVESDPDRVRKWVALTRDIIDEIWG